MNPMSLWGGVAIVKSTGFSIIELGEAVNVNSEIFKDFSRGYAYGYGFELLRISTTVSIYGSQGNGTPLLTGIPYDHQVNECHFEYYTIPFEGKIKLQSSVNYTYVMIYAHE